MSTETLAANHLEMLQASAIPEDVIAERGYRTVTNATELIRLGFSQRQASTPALLIPLHDVFGELAGYSIRPDQPRMVDGEPSKYEQPKGWRQRLDVPPRCRPMLANPAVTLYVTEGAKKADALAGQGAAAISLNGVWAWRGTNEHGGKTALSDWDAIALNERLVRVAYDSDVAQKKQVRFALVRLKAYLESKGAIVEVVYLPDRDDGSKQGVDDYFASGGTLESLSAFCRPDVADVSDAVEELRPEIVVTHRHLADISGDCWKVLEKWNDQTPFVFQHGQRLTRVDFEEDGAARLVEWTRDDVAFFLERAARFIRITDDGPVPGRLPDDVNRDLLITWEKPVPKITGVIGTPTFSRSGLLALTPGYQPETQLYYQPVGEPVPSVPDTPSGDDIARAKSLLLDDWLHDFPFADAAAQANVIAAALTPMVRELIDGPTPLFAIDAPTPGSGKGLLTETLGTLVVGSSPAVMSDLRNDEELRKRITSVLLSGVPVIVFDNVNRQLASGVLAAALTAPVWSDRRLGGNETVRIPNRALWIATGNNIALSGEIARRTVWIRIDPRMDRPWERSGFRHSPLTAWVRGHRHELLWALLVLAQHWLAEGRPRWQGQPLGSFEEWCTVTGGILEAAAIEGFLSNRDALYRHVDTESEEWRAFIGSWWDQYGEGAVQVGDLTTFAQDRELLPTVFAHARDDAGQRALRTRPGRALAQRRDRWFGDLRIVHVGADGHSKAVRYRLEREAGRTGGSAGSAKVPHENWVVSDSNAEPAELAEPFSGLEQIGNLENGTGDLIAFPVGPGPTANKVPHVPQVPHSDSNQPFKPAELQGDDGFEVPQQVPQASAPDTDRVPCAGGCGLYVPAGQKCADCAARAISEWVTQRRRQA